MTSPYLLRPIRTIRQAAIDRTISRAREQRGLPPAQPIRVANDGDRYAVDLYGPPVRLWDDAW